MGGPVTVPDGRVMWGVPLTAQDATSPHASPLLRSGNSYSGSQSSQSLPKPLASLSFQRINYPLKSRSAQPARPSSRESLFSRSTATNGHALTVPITDSTN